MLSHISQTRTTRTACFLPYVESKVKAKTTQRDVVAYIFQPSQWEAEAGGSCVLYAGLISRAGSRSARHPQGNPVWAIQDKRTNQDLMHALHGRRRKRKRAFGKWMRKEGRVDGW